MMTVPQNKLIRVYGIHICERYKRILIFMNTDLTQIPFSAQCLEFWLNGREFPDILNSLPADLGLNSSCFSPGRTFQSEQITTPYMYGPGFVFSSLLIA